MKVQAYDSKATIYNRACGQAEKTGSNTNNFKNGIMECSVAGTDTLQNKDASESSGIQKKKEILEAFPGLTDERLKALPGNYDIESMDSEELFKLAEKLMEEEIIPPRPDENGLNQIAVFPKALYDAFLRGDTSQLGGVVREASGFIYLIDCGGESGYEIPQYGLGRLKYEQQMLDDAFRRFEKYYTDDELNRHIQLANSKARFLEFAELLVASREDESPVQNKIWTEGTGENMAKMTMINGQRVYVIDREVMEAHGYTVNPDYFCQIVQTWKEGEKRDNLSADEINALKEKYNSDNMTRKECIDLLGELVEAGIMTIDEATSVYRGLIPLDITQNGMLQKCSPEMEAARARWNKVSGGFDGSKNLNRKMGYDYFEAWYDWAKLSTNVTDPEKDACFVDTRKYMELLRELRI